MAVTTPDERLLERTLTNFKLNEYTLSALDEMVAGLGAAVPSARRCHNRTFAVELAVHRVLKQLRYKKVSYKDLFLNTDLNTPPKK